MKLTTGILLTSMMVTGAAWGQNPTIVQSTKDKLNSAEQQKVAKENAALGSQSSSPAATKPSPAGAKATATPAVKPVKTTAKPAAKALISVKPATPAVKAATAATKPSAPAKTAAKAAKPAPTRIAVAPVAAQPKQGAQKTASATKKPASKRVTPFAPQKATKEAPKPAPAKASETAAKENVDAPKEHKIITAEGRRDPFVSPVVSRVSGPACSVGKRCLAIDQIIVRGVVRSENGMIAVVVNAMNKAYFLKENDPVFNGYVLRITGDSVVFKETYQDRLGKELTREVVKKITTPAV